MELFEPEHAPLAGLEGEGLARHGDIHKDNLGAGTTTVTTIAVKAADTDRANTITPAGDPHLTLPVEANSTYDVECTAVWTNGGGGFRATWTAPAGATMTWTDNDGVGVVGPTGVVTFASATGTTFKGTLITGGTAGALTFSWAQNASNASGTILRQGCALKLTRIA